MRLHQWVLGAQGLYYVATGLWPLIHMGSFLAVSGPKTDLWLVYAVGALAIAIGASLLSGAFRPYLTRESGVLSVGAAIAFAAIDCVYGLTDRIWDIYLLDALAQLIFFAGILLSSITSGRRIA